MAIMEPNDNRRQNINALFLQVQALPREERADFIDNLDRDSAAQIRDLISEYERFNIMVERASNDLDVLAQSKGRMGLSQVDDSPAIPEEIEGYSLEKNIGEGGMGSVYLAHQDSPRRTLAVKIIPRKQVSSQFLARFEGEYQALALMNHQNIAHFYGAGTTNFGNAWFSMEYIEGQTITQYCKQQNLTIKQRLALFIQVCRGMEHAHQKSIIHRDLTPANIMVTDHDGKPQAKIIDFGLAKNIEQPLSGHQTRTGSLTGTPAYMSPEQLMGNLAQVDTRCDIYSLGVMLYELLAQNHPFDLEALRELPMDEALRTLRLEEPIALSSRCQPQDRKKLKGDLDHVVAQAMAREPSDRYATVHALRNDLNCYLENRPVSARARHPLDLFAKFVRRNRLMITFACLLLLSLTGGLGFSIRSSIKANRAKLQAENSLTFMQQALTALSPKYPGGPSQAIATVAREEEALESLWRRDPSQERAIRTHLGNIYFEFMSHDHAERHLRRAVALWDHSPQHEDIQAWQARYFLARVLRYKEAHEEAEHLFLQTWKAQERILGPFDAQTLLSKTGYAITLSKKGEYAPAEQILVAVLETQRQVLGEKHRDTLLTMSSLGAAYFRQGKVDQARKILEKTIPLQSEVLGPENLETLSTMVNMGNVLMAERAYKEAEDMYRETALRQRNQLGADSLSAVKSLYGLARSLRLQGKNQEAGEVLQNVVLRRRSLLGDCHPETLNAVNLWSLVLKRQKQWQNTVDLLEGVVKNCSPREFPDEYNKIILNLVSTYPRVQAYESMINISRRYLESYAPSAREPDTEVIAKLHYLLAYAYEKSDMWEQGENHYQQAITMIEDHNLSNELLTVSRKGLAIVQQHIGTQQP